MAKESTNISHGADLKKASQEFYADLGMDLATAVTLMRTGSHAELFR